MSTITVTDGSNMNRRALCRAFAFLAVCAIALCMALFGCGTSGGKSSSSSSEVESSSTVAQSDSHLLEELLAFDVEGMAWDPSRLAEVQAENSDAYAWLYVPGTEVNHPLFQSTGDIDFYLEHDRHGNASGLGELYSQSLWNTTSFTDPVTLIYGHTYEVYSGWGDEMFSTLHNFEDPEFFDGHGYFYIFTPNLVLKYKIVSAYEYENRHVLYSNDFSDPAVLQEYFDYVVNPDSRVKNVREGMHLVAGKNRIVQLATCTRPADDAYRYLVTGVLVDGRAL